MKWKRSRKAKEQAAVISLTDAERNEIDVNDAKAHGDSNSSGLEDEEEMEGEDEKEEIEELRANSSGSSGFTRLPAGEMGKYGTYSEEQQEGRGSRTRCGALAF